VEVVAIESKAPFRHSAGKTTVNLGEGKSILGGEVWTQVLSITEYNPTDLDVRCSVYKSKWVLYDQFLKSKYQKSRTVRVIIDRNRKWNSPKDLTIYLTQN